MLTHLLTMQLLHSRHFLYSLLGKIDAQRISRYLLETIKTFDIITTWRWKGIEKMTICQIRRSRQEFKGKRLCAL